MTAPRRGVGKDIMGKTRSWTVSNSLEGFSVSLVEVPRWAQLVVTIYDRMCALTGHSLCNPPEFLFKIPVGRLRRDEDGYLEKSLGGALYSLTNKVLCVEGAREVVRFTTPVSDEVGKDLWGSGGFWDDDEDEQSDAGQTAG